MARKLKKSRGPDLRCKCGSGKKYDVCCEPFHQESEFASGPLELLRTRYCAYAVGDADYIIKTTDPDGSAWWHDEAAWRAHTRTFSKGANFLGFRVISEDIGEERGTLKFKALIKQGAKDISMVETSQFIKKDGRWLYHSGIVH